MGGDAHEATAADISPKQRELLRLDARNQHIREASGEVDIDDPLVDFLYILMRDHMPGGVVEEILHKHVLPRADVGGPVQFTNGWLATHAQDIANVLRPVTVDRPETVDRPNPTRKVKEDGS